MTHFFKSIKLLLRLQNGDRIDFSLAYRLLHYSIEFAEFVLSLLAQISREPKLSETFSNCSWNILKSLLMQLEMRHLYQVRRPGMFGKKFNEATYSLLYNNKYRLKENLAQLLF